MKIHNLFSSLQDTCGLPVEGVLVCLPAKRLNIATSESVKESKKDQE